MPVRLAHRSGAARVNEAPLDRRVCAVAACARQPRRGDDRRLRGPVLQLFVPAAPEREELVRARARARARDRVSKLIRSYLRARARSVYTTVAAIWLARR